MSAVELLRFLEGRSCDQYDRHAVQKRNPGGIES
jgi:hypothetical protein